MIKTPLSFLRVTLWIVSLISPPIYYAQGCDSGWFGSSCQYKCHCTGNNCDNKGDCTSGDTCVKGWFGPQCQYVDLSYTENNGMTKEMFRDADDITCNDNLNHQTVVMVFQRRFPFTWLRLLVSREGLLLDNIDVTFTDDNDNDNIECNNKRSAVVDSRTVDIHCDVTLEVRRVTVIGEAIGYLCSFYISGGRNVALKQSTLQSSTDYNGAASGAVDGDTIQGYEQGTCTHTGLTDANPNWNVQFSKTSNVNRYVIYNRASSQERLKGFVLTAYDQSNLQTFTHTDRETAPLSVYTITSATKSVKMVKIEAIPPVPGVGVPILTLCEVEIYGDTACPVATYGRECEQECHCANNEPCFVSTEMCPNGCAPGYTGTHCDQPCPSAKWGLGCVNTCSLTCKNQQCDRVTGRCNECPPGKTGNQCDQTCPSTKWGPRCAYVCSMNCMNQQCNAVTGICIECPSGKTGDQCDQNCTLTTYGSRCTDTCSTNCVNQLCSGDNGRCNDCPSGKTGAQCDEDCLPTQYGSRCVGTCSSDCVNQLCTGNTGRCNDCVSGKMGDSCDQQCPSTTYGPRCINDCRTTCLDSKCNGATGQCDRCPIGKFGFLCDAVCPVGVYGYECKLNCSDNCKVPKDCDSVNGTCHGGCRDGYRGDLCDEAACPRGKYGVTCDQVCNQNCRNTDCDSDTGLCKAGCVPGYYGNMCQQQCEPGKYGIDCNSACSEFCNTNGTRENESPCHPVSGACSYGCVQGYGGLKCDAKAQGSSSDSEPGVGVGVGIGVGVCVLVAITIVGVYMYRRRKLAQKSRREIPPGYDPAEPTTEEHNYSELFRSDDGYNLPTDVASSAVTFKSPSKNSRPDTVQYVNADVNEDVNDDTVQDDLKTDVTPYEDIDRITSEIDQGRKPNPGEDNTGYANTGSANSGYANTGYANF